MNNTKTLETDRLILRKFTLEDADSFYSNVASDPNVNIFLNWELHKNVDETKKLLSSWIKFYDKGMYNWIVETKDTHEIIGSICEEGKSLRHGTISLGYCYGSKYWNKGYATEVLRKVIGYLLIDEGFYLVSADHRASNPASGRVMEKAGMKYDGSLRDRKLNRDGTRSDMIFYSITKNEL